MSKQYNKAEKRVRREKYLKRKKSAAKASVKAPAKSKTAKPAEAAA